MKKIVFTGPESTGKTTLAELTAAHFNLPMVKEIARDYIGHLSRAYNYEDVVNISLLQMAEEEKIKSMHPPVMICDTDLVTIRIWCEDKFHRTESWLMDALFHRLPDIYFLCTPDFPWQHDMQREDPKRAHELFEVYKGFFIQHKLQFVELKGTVEERMKVVLSEITGTDGHLF